MSEGLVTFFKYKSLGFARRGDSYFEPLSMEVMLDSLHTWFQEKISLEDTLPWDDQIPGYSNRKKVYLKAIERNETTGDYMLILWRSIGDGNGVYGIKADAGLEDNNLYNADDNVGTDRVIWGEAAYYWFIPSLDIFASIRFPSSIADTDLMNRFMRDYVELHSDFRQRVVVEKERKGGKGKYLSISFQPTKQGETGNLWFQAYSEQFKKPTTESDLEGVADEITHFVKRDVISAQVVQQSGWANLFRGLPFVSSQVTRGSRKVEVNIEAKPTVKELKELLDLYEREYAGSDEWRNIGFRKENSGVVWLDKFVVKSTLAVNDLTGGGRDDTGHYTTERLFKAMEFKRNKLLSAFVNEQQQEAVGQ
ncbi:MULTISPECIES: hypothetical protein [Vibrio]|uniref:hypothetical protein n=1 Tax=Vibrio TaxID=662 RepID=UPI000C869712|nr:MULTISPECIES: hypothetical protein [Vibrio]ELA8074871.1 hypothetical protein [Vibrio alginolyticus]EIA1494016.1 hypothetical protein [Vibrio parahaemolyticus]ELA7319239.1 hypothetical protein [Vibrio parahaemolyticus]ELB2055252.1 hypothetical protein [Vibrio parahaemolyticus]MDW1624510.1 hypothetical protein [Vibrio sp. Vb2704]